MQRLGYRYRLLDKLGSGGMGAVYRAVDHLTGEEVALKQVETTAVSPPNPAFKLALAQEFQALAALRHPHIIAVRDYGFTEEGHPFFTMDLLPDAAPITQVGQFATEATKVDWLLQLLQALVYVHRHRLIHRDLKPGNVLVSGETVKVLDFGLATLAGETAETSGTLKYMAPELLQGQAASVASDLYAVGVMAYELFAGWHPFAETRFGLVHAILSETPDFAFVAAPETLVAVIQRLLAKKPTERYPSASATIAAFCQAAGLDVPQETAATRESFLQAAPFIGRAAERKQLLQSLSAAQQAAGSGWLIGGESGVGKSRLLQEIRTQALVRGIFVLRGQAQSNGGAFHLWRELLHALLLLAEPDASETAVLAPLVPNLEKLLGQPIAAAPPLEPEAARTRLLLTLVGLLQRAAHKRPLLLLLEDCHWADANSLELLQWHLRAIEKQPLLILATYRPGERPSLPQTLPTMQPLLLSRLSDNDISQLSAAMLGENGRDPQLVTFLQQESEGNTFFMVEVMRTLAEEAGRLDDISATELPLHIFSGGMQQVVQRRLARVPARYQGVLQLTAVAGRQLDLNLLPHLFPDLDHDNWLTLCANAVVLARPDGSLRWQFSHDKLREGLLAAMHGEQKQSLHQRVGKAIEQVYAEDMPPYYGDLAYHFGQAAIVDKERHYLQLAAETAQDTYANEMALTYYRRLLPLLTTPSEKANVQLESGHIMKLIGEWEEAEQQYQQVIATTDRFLRAKGLRALGTLQRSRANFDEALTWLVEAQRQFEALGEQAQVGEGLIEIGNVYYQQGHYGEAQRYFENALRLAETAVDPAAIAHALHNLGSVLYSQGEYDKAAHFYKQNLETSLALNNKQGSANAYNNLGNIAFRQGDYEASYNYYHNSLSIRRDIGDMWGISASLNNLGILPYLQQDYAQAEHYWTEALSMRRRLGDSWSITHSLDNLALVARAQGRYEQALQLGAESIALRRQMADKQGLAISLGNQARLLHDLRDFETAIVLYQESLTLSISVNDRRGYAFCLIGFAAARCQQKRDDLVTGLLLVAAAERLLAELGTTMEQDEQELVDGLRAQANTAVLAAAGEAAPMTLEAAIHTVLNNTHVEETRRQGE